MQYGGNNKTQLVLSHDNSIIVSNGPAAACDVSSATFNKVP